MTLPLSGPLEASDINVELGRSATAVMSITDAATGVYGAINTCSIPHPNGTAPHAYSEWYGYNHNAICLNSYYAFSPVDGGSASSGNFLRSDSIDYATNVSSNKPDPTAQFTLSMWIKIDFSTINTPQGYVTFLTTSPALDSLFQLYWISHYNGNTGVYNNLFYFYVGDAAYPGFYSTVDVSDTNNTLLSDVSSSGTLDQTGYLDDTNGYSLITIVIDYAKYGTSGYAEWYWNDTLLTVPWQTPPGNGESYTDGVSSLSGPNWTNSKLYVGGFLMVRLASECQLDGFAVFLDTALNQSDVTKIYNIGAVAPISSYTNISSNLLFYNFESDNPNIGIDTGGTYSMNLDELNNPQRVQDPAL
jgi:hypothetical protein